MNIHVMCPTCGRASTISAAFAGRQLECPECKQSFAAPARPSRWVFHLLHGAYLMLYGCCVIVGTFVIAMVVAAITFTTLAAPEPPRFEQAQPIRPPASKANGYSPAAR